VLRKLTITFAILATLATSTASAQMVIPSHINLHNGYVVVINTISPKREYTAGVFEPWYPPAPLVQLSWSGYKQSTNAPYGERAYLNSCCIAAGTEYGLTFHQGGYQTGVDVRPRLCNVRGIPFGYAVVEVVGPYVWHHNGISGTPSVHVVDAPCPVDPPR
jgi:hypothetical protein